MATLPILAELPCGFFLEESPRGVLALHADVARELHERGFGPERDGELVKSELAGRRPLYDLGGGLLLRRFSHGGLTRWLTGVRYLDPERPFRELILSHSLRSAGIRTPQIVAARARLARGVGWHLDVVARRVPDSVDLGYVLGMARRGELERSALRSIARAAGELVRQLHRHGCMHADLTPSNILVGRDTLREGAAAELWVIDLDRSTLVGELGHGRRLLNLRRLYRFVRRRDREHGRALSSTDYARFFRGYDPDRGHWKADWRLISAAHSRSRLLHSLGWFFESAFGRAPDPRDAAAESERAGGVLGVHRLGAGDGRGGAGSG